MESGLLELEIFDLSTAGSGVARRADGKVVFVTGALPGEKVLARPGLEKKDFLQAETMEVIKTSPDRVEPPCPYYAECGGCNLMHLAYSTQLKSKTGWLKNALRKFETPAEIEITPSPENGFRNRVRFQHKNGKIGFFAKNSNDLVQVENCLVSHPGVNRMLAELDRCDLAECGSVEVMATDDGACLTFGYDKKHKLKPGQADEMLELARELGVRGAAVSHGNRIIAQTDLAPGNGLVYYEDESLALRGFAGMFSQVNHGVNRAMIAKVRSAAQAMEKANVLDLYAGTGNLSLPLAAAGCRVTAVEYAGLASKAGRAQAEWLGLDEYYTSRTGDAAKVLAGLRESGERFELAILDPPRAGAKEVMAMLRDIAPRRLVYISCHPAAMARDLMKFAEKNYVIKSINLLDMFAHTNHYEAVVVMDET